VTAPALLRTRAGVIALGAGVLSFAVLNLPVATPALWRTFYELNFVRALDGLDSGNHGLLYLIYLAVRDLGVGWTLPRWQAVTSTAQLVLLGGTAVVALLSRHPARVLLGGAALVLAHLLSY